jgi:hypothetical protein
VTSKHAVCNLGHRIRKTISFDGAELVVYQCCDSRECLFKIVKGGATFCCYGDQAADGRDSAESIRDQHHKGQQ